MHAKTAKLVESVKTQLGTLSTKLDREIATLIAARDKVQGLQNGFAIAIGLQARGRGRPPKNQGAMIKRA